MASGGMGRVSYACSNASPTSAEDWLDHYSASRIEMLSTDSRVLKLLDAYEALCAKYSSSEKT